MDPPQNNLDRIQNSLTNALRLCSPNARTEDLVLALDQVLADLDRQKFARDETLGKLVMFPVFQLLKRDSLPDQVTDRVLKLMRFTLAYCWNSNLQSVMAKQLLDVILYLIGGPPTSVKQPSDYFLTQVSDDTKNSGCTALIALYQASLASHISQQLADSPASASFNITVLLNCIEHGSQLLNLQLSALEALDKLCLSLIASGDKLSLMLPGIISTLTKTLAGKFGRCHYKLKQHIYNFLSHLLPVIFDDNDFEPPAAAISGGKRFRTESWLETTKEQMTQAFGSFTVSAAKSNQRSEVYESMASFYAAIISHCFKTLDSCIGICIDGLVYISSLHKEHPRAAEQSRFALERFAAVPDIKKKIEARINGMVESIPRVFSKHHESEPLSVINGLVTLISTIPTLDDTLVTNLISTLSSSLQVKPVDHARGADGVIPASVVVQPQISTDYNYASKVLDLPSQLQVVRVQDLGLSTDLSGLVQTSVFKLLSEIGRSPKLGVSVLESLFNRVSSSTSGISGSISICWMLTGVLSGIVEAKHTSSRADEVMQLLNTDLVSDGDHDVVDITDDLVFDISNYCVEKLSEAGNVQAYGTDMNAQYICFSLTALSLAASYFGKDFRHSLVDVLFPTVNMLGHTDGFVVNAAQKTIITMAMSCEYTTVRELLVENVDYLLDGISIKLNTLDITPQTPKMLSSMVKLTGPSVIQYMDDLVASLFVILDNYHGYSKLCDGIFDVCRAFADEVGKAYKLNATITDTPVFEETVKPLRSSKFVHITTVSRLIELLNYTPQIDEDKLWSDPNAGQEDQKDSDDDDDDDLLNRYDSNGNLKNQKDPLESKPLKNSEEEEAEKWPSVIPKPTYMIIKKIVEYCTTFLTHESKILRYNLIVLITNCLPLIATNQEEFLPLVNQFWPVLVSSLGKDEVFITEATLQCIGISCSFAGDFMRSRIAKLWESGHLRQFVSLKTIDKLPEYSNEARLIRAVVHSTVAIVTYTAVSAEIFDSMVRVFKPHFAGFPKLKVAFERVNADVVWLEEYYDGQKQLTL